MSARCQAAAALWITLFYGVMPAGAAPLRSADDDKKPPAQELRRLKGHTDAVWSVAFSPDGKFGLSGSYDHTALLWDTTTGQIVRRFEGHAKAILAVAF